MFGSARGRGGRAFTCDGSWCWSQRRDLAAELFFAALEGRSIVVAQMLSEGAQVNDASGEHGAWTPLSIAAFKGHDDVVALLLAFEMIYIRFSFWFLDSSRFHVHHLADCPKHLAQTQLSRCWGNYFHVLSLELGGADKCFAVHESETTLPPSWALQFLDVECLDTN